MTGRTRRVADDSARTYTWWAAFEHGRPVVLNALQYDPFFEQGVQHQGHAILKSAIHDDIAVHVGTGQSRDHRILFASLMHQCRHLHVQQDIVMGQAGALRVACRAGGVAYSR